MSGVDIAEKKYTAMGMATKTPTARSVPHRKTSSEILYHGVNYIRKCVPKQPKRIKISLKFTHCL